MLIVIGRLRLTLTDYLPFLVNIKPAKLRQQGATLSLVYRSETDESTNPSDIGRTHHCLRRKTTIPLPLFVCGTQAAHYLS